MASEHVQVRASEIASTDRGRSMQQYLYRIQPTRLEMLAQGPSPSESRVVAEHFAYLQQLVAQGVVLLAGRTLLSDERGFGIVVFGAPSEPAAQEIVANDPAVLNGVMRAELFPFRVALWSGRGPGGAEGTPHAAVGRTP